MKPVSFDFRAPRELDEALDLLAQYGDESKVLAGGQSLIPLLNFRLAQPAMLIDINRIAELAGLEIVSGGLYIRAATRESMLDRSPVVATGWPLLREASGHVGHEAIRNRGTIGGSAAHADPSGELPAALLALDARFHAKSVRGERTLEAREFFVGQWTSALDADELLVAIDVPARPARSGSAFIEFARKHGDFALAGAAVQLALDDSGNCTEIAIALLAAASTPIRAGAAEAALIGQRIDAVVAREAAVAAAGESDPAPPADYHRALIEECVSQALLLAAERATS
jgi:carbon-monoxide dehydrogenase medium subunit/6-hydroxypseudooxynicotine dehydrogenase subunit alpha